MSLVLHDFVQEVLVLYLGTVRVKLSLESGVLLKHLFASVYVRDYLFWLEYRNGPLTHIQVKRRLCSLYKRIVLSPPLCWMTSPRNCVVQREASLHWRDGVQTSIVVEFHLGKIGHCLVKQRTRFPRKRRSCIWSGVGVPSTGSYSCVKKSFSLACINGVNTFPNLVRDLVVLALRFSKLWLGPRGSQSLFVKVATIASEVKLVIYLDATVPCLSDCGGRPHVLCRLHLRVKHRVCPNSAPILWISTSAYHLVASLVSVSVLGSVKHKQLDHSNYPYLSIIKGLMSSGTAVLREFTWKVCERFFGDPCETNLLIAWTYAL